MPAQLPAMPCHPQARFNKWMRQIIPVDSENVPSRVQCQVRATKALLPLVPPTPIARRTAENGGGKIKNPARTFPHKNPSDTLATTSTVIGPKYRKWEPDCKKKLHFLQTLHVCVCK